LEFQNSNSLSKKTKEIINNFNIHLNKNFGQHYLIDKNKRDQIINFANLNKNDVVLEIGPGIGTLTFEIAEQVKKVIAIEKDPKIFHILQQLINENNVSNIELINNDALDVDFPHFNKIISNLPYQISSPITFKFLEYDFDSAILMYQKEFANRMTGITGSKEYSRLSAMLHFKCDVEFLTDVSKESFFPKPKIDSSVVKLSPSLSEDFQAISKEDYEVYSIFTKALFQHKNKKSKNALIDSRHVLGHNDKKEIKKLIENIKSSKIDDLLSQKVFKTSPEEILFLSRKLNFILEREK